MSGGPCADCGMLAASIGEPRSAVLGAKAGRRDNEETARRAGERLAVLRRTRGDFADAVGCAVDGLLAGREVECVVIDLRDALSALLLRAAA